MENPRIMESTDVNQAWSQPEQFDAAMAAIGEQDFNLGEIDFNSFDFLNFDPNSDKIATNIDLNLLSDNNNPQSGLQQRPQSTSAPPNSAQNAEIFDINMQMGYGHQHHQAFSIPQGQHPIHSMIPPTPNSIEMHGDRGRYMQHFDAQSRALLEQHFHMQNGDALSFTPLGTPAVTPHEAQFNVAPEFTIPGAYFSPLSSPALEGQQHQNGVRTTNNSTGASPHRMDIDSAQTATQKPGRKPKKARLTMPRNGKVPQSPIHKSIAQRRKSALSAVIPPKEVSELLEQYAQSHLSPTSPTMMRSSYTSSTDSISPEPLSESLMGPPPKPTSAKPSPAIVANKSPNLQANGKRLSPATPASLMRLQQPHSQDNFSIATTLHEHETEFPMLDDLALPEPAASDSSRPNLTRLDTAMANGEKTPRMSARKAPKTGPLSTPNGTVRNTPFGSAVTSPQSAIASPVSSRRPDLKTKKSSKRGSISSSALVSPALRPKISPSIKPLLPEGASLNDDARTIFLASRSNYQNLIEGTNLPGVSYPSDLPTQLTSKRTSHKIAEQGRRQRINIAISELQTLLPKSSPVISAKGGSGNNDDEDDEDEDGKKGKGSGNSKAATVEAGIAYIKILQRESERMLAERDREVDALRKRLEQMERQLGKGSEGSLSECSEK
ncbi:hypothetical protein EJ08DRAFT_248566 [Tothia fuscella]|uniref:BHLH domain-containing protein n=1 Tax=Tothia fuscella TaxID=1048955 RepID=A0A9P4NRY1_9PEZI|nr:hypothetical protein EJ08DRAFT_248566 [Tothia fuscella]